MIRYNELRLGNKLICYNYGVTVESINSDWVTDLVELGRFDLQDCEPIPLTPELLMKCGFKKNGEWGELDLPQRMSIRFYNFNCAECDIVQDGKFIAFKNSAIIYLHQLQNLFFVLSGEELKINLEI